MEENNILNQEESKQVGDTLNAEVKNTDSKELDKVENESYAGYNAFVFISAIIGFISVLFLTRIGIDKANEKNLFNLVDNKLIISIFAALIFVILFMFFALSLKKFLKKIFLSEIFLYLYMGVLTTVVNVVSYELIRNSLSNKIQDSNLTWKIAEVVAFIIAVIFAFVTNKIFVFRSFSINPAKVFSELGMFFGARVITEGINFFIMWIMIDKNNYDEFLSKIIASVVVIVLNYIFSKFIIFKRKKEEIKKVEEE